YRPPVLQELQLDAWLYLNVPSLFERTATATVSALTPTSEATPEARRSAANLDGSEATEEILLNEPNDQRRLITRVLSSVRTATTRQFLEEGAAKLTEALRARRITPHIPV